MKPYKKSSNLIWEEGLQKDFQEVFSWGATVKIKYLRSIRPGSQNIAAMQWNDGDNDDGITQLKSFSSRSF